MQNMQNVKTVGITPPAAIIDNAAATTAAINTTGFTKARIMVYFGAMDIAAAVLKVTHSDDSGMSGEVDIAGADFSVLPLTLPSASDDNHFYAVFLDLRGKKLYLDLKLTLGDGSAGTYVTAWVDLYGAATAPDTAAERGLTQQAIV